MGGSRPSSVSCADTLEKMGEFWDRHDFTEHDTDAADVEFTVTCAVPVEVELLSSVEEEARRRGVSVETLINLWLSQKLAEQAQAARA